MYTEGTTDRTPNLLISSSVYYVHLGGDNNHLIVIQPGVEPTAC